MVAPTARASRSCRAGRVRRTERSVTTPQSTAHLQPFYFIAAMSYELQPFMSTAPPPTPRGAHRQPTGPAQQIQRCMKAGDPGPRSSGLASCFARRALPRRAEARGRARSRTFSRNPTRTISSAFVRSRAEQRTALIVADKKVALASDAHDLIDRQIEKLEAALQQMPEEFSSVIQQQMGGSLHGGAASTGSPAALRDGGAGSSSNDNGGGGSGGSGSGRRKAAIGAGAPAFGGAGSSSGGAGPSGAGPSSLVGGIPGQPVINTSGTHDPETEETFCSCGRISFGEMVCCDNPQCALEWFHFGCVGLTEAPIGAWLCPVCTLLQGSAIRSVKRLTQQSSSNDLQAMDNGHDNGRGRGGGAEGGAEGAAGVAEAAATITAARRSMRLQSKGIPTARRRTKPDVAPAAAAPAAATAQGAAAASGVGVGAAAQLCGASRGREQYLPRRDAQDAGREEGEASDEGVPRVPREA